MVHINTNGAEISVQKLSSGYTQIVGMIRVCCLAPSNYRGPKLTPIIMFA
jgi:hypothetical protein